MPDLLWPCLGLRAQLCTQSGRDLWPYAVVTAELSLALKRNSWQRLSPLRTVWHASPCNRWSPKSPNTQAKLHINHSDAIDPGCWSAGNFPTRNAFDSIWFHSMLEFFGQWFSTSGASENLCKIYVCLYIYTYRIFQICWLPLISIWNSQANSLETAKCANRK